MFGSRDWGLGRVLRSGLNYPLTANRQPLLPDSFHS